MISGGKQWHLLCHPESDGTNYLKVPYQFMLIPSLWVPLHIRGINAGVVYRETSNTSCCYSQTEFVSSEMYKTMATALLLHRLLYWGNTRRVLCIFVSHHHVLAGCKKGESIIVAAQCAQSGKDELCCSHAGGKNSCEGG